MTSASTRERIPGFVLLFLLLGYSFTCGCSTASHPSPALRAELAQSAQENDIRESVFRYRIGLIKSHQPVFLSISGNDPSNAFLARFTDFGHRIQKSSSSYYDAYTDLFRDHGEYEQGTKLSVGTITWENANSVKVHGGSSCGNIRCADAGVYYLSKKNNHWTVESYAVQTVP
jgi:hypothetical protein